MPYKIPESGKKQLSLTLPSQFTLNHNKITNWKPSSGHFDSFNFWLTGGSN